MVAFFTALSSIAKKIPWQVWLLSGVIVAFWGWGEFNFSAGKKQVQAEWESSIEKGKLIVDKLKEDAHTVTVVTEVKYLDRVTTIREKGDEIIKKVPVYIPSDSCPLPGGFRVLHDSAAVGTLPGDARETNGAPVPVRTVASTVTRNYTTCHTTAQRLISLQDWAVEVCQLYNREIRKKDRTRCILPYEVHNKDTLALE